MRIGRIPPAIRKQLGLGLIGLVAVAAGCGGGGDRTSHIVPPDPLPGEQSRGEAIRNAQLKEYGTIGAPNRRKTAGPKKTN